MFFIVGVDQLAGYGCSNSGAGQIGMNPSKVLLNLSWKKTPQSKEQSRVGIVSKQPDMY